VSTVDSITTVSLAEDSKAVFSVFCEDVPCKIQCAYLAKSDFNSKCFKCFTVDCRSYVVLLVINLNFCLIVGRFIRSPAVWLEEIFQPMVSVFD